MTAATTHALRLGGATPASPNRFRDLNDSEVVARHLEGDRLAFEELVDRYQRRLLNFVYRTIGDRERAEDLVQEVFIRVHRHLHRFDQTKKFSTWIYTIARNARIDRMRRNSSQPYDDLEGVDLPSDDVSGEDQAFASQRAERVGQALADLPDDQKRIIELAYVYDLSQREIADKLDVPLGTVKSRMRLAYGKLKLQLEDVR